MLCQVFCIRVLVTVVSLQVDIVNSSARIVLELVGVTSGGRDVPSYSNPHQPCLILGRVPNPLTVPRGTVANPGSPCWGPFLIMKSYAIITSI